MVGSRLLRRPDAGPRLKLPSHTADRDKADERDLRRPGRPLRRGATPTTWTSPTCDEGKYVMWEDAAGGQRWTYGPGAVDRLWIVEVDSFSPDAAGGLLVIDAASQPGTSPEGLAELQAIVDSIEIELLPGS